MTGLIVPDQLPEDGGRPRVPRPDPLGGLVQDVQRFQRLAGLEPETVEPVERTVFDDIADDEQRFHDRRLRQSMAVALRTDPDFAAEAQRIGLEINVSPLQVEKDIEGYRYALQRVQADRWMQAEYSPVLRRQLENPDFARLAHDDLRNLGFWEALLQRGRSIAEQGTLFAKMRDTGLSQDETARLEELTRYINTTEATGIFAEVGEFLGQMGQMGLQVGKTGLATGLGTGALGLLGGPATAASAGVAGLVAGSAAEVWRQTALMEGGFKYRELLDERFDPTTAAVVSHLHGGVAGLLEVAGTALTLSGVGLVARPVRRAFLQATGRETLQALANPSTGQAALELAKGYLLGVASETAEEGLQEVSSIVFQDVARAVEGRLLQLTDPAGQAEAAKQVGEVMAKTARAMALIGAVGPAATYVADVRRLKSTEAELPTREQAAELARESKVRERNPAAHESFTGKVLEGSGTETTYVEASKFAEAFQQSGMSREELSEVLPGVPEQLDRALVTGGDVSFPTSRYFARVLDTELGNALAQHTRTDPEGYSEAELPDVKAAQKPMLKQATEAVEKEATFDQMARAVEVEFEKQVVATGRLSKRQSRDTAAVFRAFVETQSRRLGITPEEFAQRFGVQVVRGEVAAATPEQLAQGAPDTEAFRNWFGEGQPGANANNAGHPLTLYHGTPTTFTEFRPSEGGAAGPGIYLAKTPDKANVFAGAGGQVMAVYARGNFLRIPFNELIDAPKWNEKARAEGYDGLDTGIGELVVFDPSNIKSISNRGTFDPNDPNILRAEDRAAFDPEKGIIALFENADITSVLHEMSHGFLHWYGQMAAHPDAPAQVVADMEAFLKSRGIDGGVQTWNAMSLDEQRPHHEAFAKQAENYFFDGKAPSQQLQPIFARFRRWIAKLWRNVRGQATEVTPEVRAMLDRMLATDDAIAHAEAVRGTTPLFEAKPEGVTDEQWEAHQKEVGSYVAAVGSVKDRQALQDQVQAEVRAEVEKEPVYRAREFIRTGKFITEEGTQVDFEGVHKLHTDSVRDLLPEGTDLRTVRLTSPDGMDPDAMAEMFGFGSGKELVDALMNAAPIEGAVAVRTHRRMMEQHDADAVQKALADALLEPTKSRVLASEIRLLDETVRPVRVMVAAAREMAQRNLATMPVAHIRPWRFQGAEARASRAAIRAVAKGDRAAAIEAKWTELLQREMAREAARIEKAVETASRKFRDFFDTDKDIAKKKRRDIDLVNAGRALLRSLGFRPAAEGQQARQEAGALALVARDFQVLYSDLSGAMEDFAGPLRALTWEQFANVRDVLEHTWEMARVSNLIEVEGRKMERATAVAQLAEAITAQPKRLAPGAQPDAGISPYPGARLVQGFWHLEAANKTLLHWSQFMDRGEDGPFQDLFLRPMFSRIDEVRAYEAKVMDRIAEGIRSLEKHYGPKWDATIRAPQLDHLDPRDGTPVKVRIRGVRELVPMLLHTGNPSNLAKLVVGMGVAPDPRTTDGLIITTKWDKFFEDNLRTAENPDGLIGPEVMDFVQSIWNEFEALRPRAQEVHKRLFGYEFREVEIPDEFRVRLELPWKTYKGGYAPVQVDQDRARNPRRNQSSLESLQAVEEDFAYSRAKIGVGRNFTLERNPNYFDVLTTDLGRTIRGISQELKFIHLQPHVRTVLSIVEDPAFSTTLAAYDRHAKLEILLPWLETTARQSISKPSGTVLYDTIWSVLRGFSSVKALGWNATVTLVQLTGLNLVGTQVKAKFWRAGAAHVVQNPIAAWREAAALDPRMEERLNTHQLKTQQFIQNQSLGKVWRSIAAFRQAGGRAAHGPTRIMQGLVDITAWHAAYQQSLAESSAGLSPEQVQKRAIQDAHLAVERSQGSSNPESVAKTQTGTPGYRLLVQFLSFANTFYNLILSRSAARETTLGKIGDAVWIVFVMTVWEEVIRSLLKGSGLDEDDDEELLDDIAYSFGKSALRNVGGMVPVIGPALADALANEPSRVGAAPAVSTLQTLARGASNIATKGQASWQEWGAIATAVTNWPLMPVFKALDYEEKVESGEVKPANTADRIRGLIVGR